MPCNADHMNPSQNETESRLVAMLTMYVDERLGLESSQVIRDAAESYYGNRSMVHEFTAALCAMLASLTPKQEQGIVYDGRNALARRLADWWDAHKIADAKRGQ